MHSTRLLPTYPDTSLLKIRQSSYQPRHDSHAPVKRKPLHDVSPTHCTLRQPEDTDTVTGLPNSQTFSDNLQRWLLRQPHTSQFVAAHIQLPTVLGESGSTGIDNTLQDLLAYRASVLLTQHTWPDTLLGRADRQSLLLAQLCRRRPTSHCRQFLRHLLGDLGGLIEDPSRIVVTTLVSSVSTLSADETIHRLLQ